MQMETVLSCSFLAYICIRNLLIFHANPFLPAAFEMGLMPLAATDPVYRIFPVLVCCYESQESRCALTNLMLLMLMYLPPTFGYAAFTSTEASIFIY